MTKRVIGLILCISAMLCFAEPPPTINESGWYIDIPINGYWTEVCWCPNDPLPDCFCWIDLPHQPPPDICSYLRELPSFIKEDEDYFYFKATIRPNTRPPVYDITNPGPAKVKWAKSSFECE